MAAYDLPERDPHPGYTLAPPAHPRPIVLVGAGGIVRDAHLPAYAKAGFEVASITDLQLDRATALAEQYDVPATYDDVAAAVASSWHVIWKQPAPSMQTTVASGRAAFAPIAAGRP